MNKEITLICVSNAHHELVNFSFKKCLENIPYIKEVIFFSDKSVPLCNTFIKIKKDFTYKDYNNFILKNLYYFVDTDYVIIIQPDSMAVNKNLWTDDFLKFDYAGAQTEGIGTYNGGFTLRSKKLLNALLDSEIKVLECIKNNSFFCYKEDTIITHYYKNFLQEFYNIKFCDDNIAKKFSTDILHNDITSFGFHGAHNSLKFLSYSDAVNMITQLYKNTNKWHIYDNLIKNFNEYGFDKANRIFYKELIDKNMNNISGVYA
jgi:hypothetical protein